MIRVLFVESNPNDASMALRLARDVAPPQVELIHVEQLSTALRRLGRESFEAILLDLDLVDTHGLETFNQIQIAFARLPIVLLVGREDEPIALQAIRHGAQDYLFKQTYTGVTLSEAIRKAVERKQAEKGLTYLAQYDNLTNVANRTLFRDRAVQALARSKRKDQKVVFLHLGLDNFKRINDTLGHEGGDIVLKTAAQRLQICLREVDTIARQWGDEFTVLLEEMSGETNIEVIAQRILHAMSDPFEAGDQQVNVTASIGVALFPRDGVSVNDLLKSAETAMNRAKQEGGNMYCFYTAEQV